MARPAVANSADDADHPRDGQFKLTHSLVASQQPQRASRRDDPRSSVGARPLRKSRRQMALSVSAERLLTRLVACCATTDKPNVHLNAYAASYVLQVPAVGSCKSLAK